MLPADSIPTMDRWRSIQFRSDLPMPGFLGDIKMNGSKLETPLTIQQVESHLVFGPISRHFPLAYVAWAVVIIRVITALCATGRSWLEYLLTVAESCLWLLLPYLLSKMSLRQQAIVGWAGVKGGLGFAAFMMATVGAGVAFQRGQSDAWPLLCLGVIWIPWIEFLPKVAPHQKYVTIARLVLSIPCVILGVRSGYWHW
jgi:hypothetical protein